MGGAPPRTTQLLAAGLLVLTLPHPKFKTEDATEVNFALQQRLAKVSLQRVAVLPLPFVPPLPRLPASPPADAAPLPFPLPFFRRRRLRRT